MKHDGLLGGHGVVGTGQPVEDRDLAEPYRRLDEGQQHLFAVRRGRRDADRAIEDGEEPAREIAAGKEPLALRQVPHDARGEQVALKARRAGPRTSVPPAAALRSASRSARPCPLSLEAARPLSAAESASLSSRRQCLDREPSILSSRRCPMKPLVDQLSQYASYHRDRRNIATHLVGIPMIVVGIEALLARAVARAPRGAPDPRPRCARSRPLAFYLALDRRYGVAMAVFLAASLWVGTQRRRPAHGHLAARLCGASSSWAGSCSSSGTASRERSPRSWTTSWGCSSGPLFIVAEVGFALGLRDEVREVIEAPSRPDPRRPDRAASAS